MENEIKELKEKIKRLKSGIRLLELYGEKLKKADACIKAHIETIVVYKLEDVAKVKNILRKDFDHFEFVHSFYSQGVAISTWESPDVSWKIWLETSINDFPDELKHDSCKWMKTSTIKDDYVLVCEKEQ
jgi:hypothetical protein